MKWDTVLTALLVVCALTTTAVVIHLELFTQSRDSAQADRKPAFIQSWKSELRHGVSMGSTNAPVQLIEFGDFECAFCGTFHRTLKVLRAKYPVQVSLTYVHFPLAMHRFALPAARVAECAAEQGHFEAMYDQLFEEQESFGLKPWNEYGAKAGVPDLAQFDTCIKKSDPIPRVEEGKQLGKKLDVQGTPTLIINGWKLGHPPSEVELGDMVKAVLAGKEPVSGAGKS
jgi:protein-disulfide isomerase